MNHHIIDTNKEIPDPQPNALDIIALVKDSGRVTGYELSDGRIVSRGEGVQLARDHMIKDVAIAENKGTEYLRSLPDDTEANNMGNLPTRRMDSFFMRDDWDEESWEDRENLPGWETERHGEKPYQQSSYGETPLSR